MKFINFRTAEDRACITPEQLAMLLEEESKAAAFNNEVNVALVSTNFENKGNLMMVVTPIDYHDEKMDKYYKYQANFMSQDPEISGKICGMYSNDKLARFHVESFYGANTIAEFDKIESEMAARISEIEKSKREREL